MKTYTRRKYFKITYPEHFEQLNQNRNIKLQKKQNFVPIILKDMNSK